MIKQKKHRRSVRILLIVLCVWLLLCAIDLVRVAGMREKPLFTLHLFSADDGGSGSYYGFLYHFDIEGDFMPEDTPPHVISYTWHLFGIPLIKGSPILKD